MSDIFENISLDTIVQIVSLLIATLTFIISQAIEKRRDRAVANRDTYQKLEFASIDLFRFEADNVDLIRSIWEKGKDLPAKGTAEYIVTMNYVCQMLNLFEIAIKFRKEKILPPEIFGSWVAWFHLLITAPGFPEIWEDVKWDYLPNLRSIMNGGIQIMHEESDEDIIESKFYEFVSFVLKCNIIKDWTNNNEDSPYDDFWKKENITPSKVKTNSIPENEIKINWLNDEKDVESLVELFIKNSTSNYISHGEIQEGRAKNETTWSDNINKHLANEFRKTINNKILVDSNLVGAYIDNKIVGFIFLEYTNSPNGTYATLADIIVDKKYRHNNIGKKLINWAIPKLKEKQIQNIFAESNISNDPAHGFLKKLGFKTLSKVFKKDI